MSTRPRSSRILRRLPTVLLLPVSLAVVILLLVGGGSPQAARAQAACVPDAEPNDELETAGTFAGAGCVAGLLGTAADPAATDQDLFVWTVSERDAAARWTFTLVGVLGGPTGLDVVPVTSAPGDPLAVGEPLLRVDAAPGAPGTAADVLVAPGRYLLGVSKGAGGGDYRFDVAPGAPPPPSADAEPNDTAETASAVAGAFAVSGALAGSEDWFAWEVPSGNQTWRLAVQAELGTVPRLTLLAADGQTLVERTADGRGRLAIEDLALAAGVYRVRLYPAVTDAPGRYTMAATAGDPSQETEPNDDATGAAPITPGVAVRGRLAGTLDSDFYRLTIGDDLADTLVDVKVLWRDGPDRRLCMLAAADATEVRCQSGAKAVAFNDLVLPPGDYLVAITGEPADGALYVLRVDATVAADPGFEAEPNDTQAMAVPLGPGDTNTVRGRLLGDDQDYFQFEVAGDPQLWQAEVVGAGITALASYGAGTETARAGLDAATGRARLSDLFLVPGTHWVSVAGAGDYELRVVPLGPPDPQGEREPNNDATRGQPLPLTEARTGRLAEAEDIDVYRFSLAATERISLRL